VDGEPTAGGACRQPGGADTRLFLPTLQVVRVRQDRDTPAGAPSRPMSPAALVGAQRPDRATGWGADRAPRRALIGRPAQDPAVVASAAALKIDTWASSGSISPRIFWRVNWWTQLFQLSK
jgi:hypothetical protein